MALGQIKIEEASQTDFPFVSSLLSDFSLPLDGIEETRFWIARNGIGSVVGCVGLEVHGRQGLLRSLAVRREFQEFGLGTRLAKHAVSEARRLGLEEIYLLTESAARFFSKRVGFVALEKEAKLRIEGDIKKSREFQGACPESAILMRRRLLRYPMSDLLS
jgi:N-acetylglutamate synthase-like GNAT family acetyltransferase